MPELSLSLEARINKILRDVPDFPKPGIVFKDISPLFYNQALCSRIVDEFLERLHEKPDALIGIESRGFLFGFLMANKLDIPFVFVRKAGKLPAATISVEYELEYGSAKMEMHADALKPGWKVLIHDDLLATGGTAEAAARLVKKAGASVSAFNFVIGLDFLQGEEKLKSYSNQIICLTHL
ncbi:MAG TPA: adenine phosphoribosyltransferase [Bacteroidia bacterium]|nr:adenine phosphoribosyltransferase [Bacteroidia bacterium]